MKIYESKNFQIVAAIIAVVIILGFFLSGMGGGDAQEGTQVLKDEKGNVLKDESGNEVKFNPTSYTDALNDLVSSKAWGFRDTSALVDLMKLNDSQLLAVASDWRKRYYREEKETILAALDGESFWGEDDATKTALIARMRKLNIG